MKKRSAKAALELIEDGMIVGLGGGETIGYLVEYLSHSHKDVKVVTPCLRQNRFVFRLDLNYYHYGQSIMLIYLLMDVMKWIRI